MPFRRSRIAVRLKRYRDHLPRYLAFQAEPWALALAYRWFYRHCIPKHQAAPIIVCTMGKVATTS
ncbi:MAG: hypothetical protein ACTS5I_16350, partial [Rhodanobacter sp.]